MEKHLTPIEYTVATLRKSVFLAGLEESVLAALASKTEPLLIESGKTIVTKGEIGSTMYIIIAGAVRVHDEEVTLATLRPGDVFGEMSVLDSEVRSASVTTECESLVLCIDRDAFYEALSAKPEAFKAVIHAVLQGKRGLIGDIKTRSLRLLSYQKEMEIGRRIQAHFLPKSVPDPEGWEIAACLEAARDVTGDFYDVFRLTSSSHLAIVIGDVCDKGVGAALFMTLFRSLIRATSLYGCIGSSLVDADPETAANPAHGILLNSMHTTNRYIATTHAGSSMFASVFFGLLDTHTGELSYVNAGHETPIIFRNNGTTEMLANTGGVVGLFPAANFEVLTTTLNKGDLIFTYSDGVNEAKNAEGHQFGEERILKAATSKGDGVESFLRDLLNAIRQFRGEADQSDDITMLALKYLAADQTV
jgi:serine phosphatase RsbU (regulator of sigma subunit)